MHSSRLLLLLLLLTPQLMTASPLIVADVEPILQEILDEETSSSDSKSSSKPLRHIFYQDDSFPKESNPPVDLMFDLDPINTNEVEIPRTEDKRSGLRAAMLARGGRGVKLRSGWQIGGVPLTVLAEPEYENSLVSRRSQPSSGSAYLGVVSSGGPMHGQIKPVSGATYSPGVLSNVEDYFQGLRSSLNNLSDEPQKIGYSKGSPMRTDAYLHGSAPMMRPSDKVRLFVQDPGPLALRGANGHDPALLWTGIGRR